MKRFENRVFEGERVHFMNSDTVYFRCVFQNGESPLKESRNIQFYESTFRWKYPIWYSNSIECHNMTFDETARSGVWNTKNIKIFDSNINAPKTFRRSSDIELINVTMNNASETLWNCDKVKLVNVSAKGDYFGMNSTNVEAINLTLNGNYCFDGGKNVAVRDSTLNSKDSFWNCENVTITNCKINGEYIGWNSKNLTFINCEITSHQGLCYINGLKMVNCKLINSDLCFEFCENIDAEIVSVVDSIKNPYSGKIKVLGVKKLILENDKIDSSKVEITLYGK